MTLREALTEADRRGIRLASDDGRLRYEAPTGALTAEFRAALMALKPELVSVVWRLEAMHRHGVDLTPDRRYPQRPPVAVASWPGIGSPGHCLSCDDALEHPQAA